jgi:hypothetical protein
MNKRERERSQANAKRGRDPGSKPAISKDTTPVTEAESSKKKPLKVKKVNIDSGQSALQIQLPSDPELASMKLLETFGTPDTDLQAILLKQVLMTFDGCRSSKGSCNDDELVSFGNQALALLQGIAPRDAIEGLLAIQMISVHNVAMQTMKMAMFSNQTFEGKEASVNQANKMLRTFVAQMEALRKHRSGGQQKVTVEHVHINKGGQAIVGTVNPGGGGKE